MEEWRPCFLLPLFSQLTRVWKNDGHVTPQPHSLAPFLTMAAIFINVSFSRDKRASYAHTSQQETERMAKSFYFYAQTLKLIAELP
jgi:hypothetical protein